jgi:hypothetical protein
VSARFTVADLAASGVLDVGRNRETILEATRGVAAFGPVPSTPRPWPKAEPPDVPGLAEAGEKESAATNPACEGGAALRATAATDTLSIEGRQRLAEAAGLPVQARQHESTLSRSGGRVGEAAAAAEEGKGCTPPFRGFESRPDLHALALAVLGEPRRLPRLDGEDAIQADIVFRLDVGTRAGRWCIIPVILRNDIRVRTASDAELTASPALAHWHQRQERQAWREGARAKAMGLRPGAPDLLLLSPVGFGLLECKSRGVGLRPEQRAWRDLAAATGWHWGLARSWDDALRALRAWGWLP